MSTVKIYKPIDNESFLGMGENGFIDRIVNEIQSVPEGENLDIEINTPGGYVSDGMTIASAIAEHNGKVNMYVRGMAASMGAVLLAFSDYAEANEYSNIMIHKAYTRNSEPSEETVNMLNKTNKDLVKAFKRRGVNAELIDEIFGTDNQKNYWFTANEARKIGLIDKVNKSVRTSHNIAASIEERNQLIDKFSFWGTENINFEDTQTYKSLTKGGVMSLFNKKNEQEASEQLEEIVNSFNELNTKFEEKVQAVINKNLESKADELKSVTDSIEANSNLLKEIQVNFEKVNEVIASLQKSVKEIDAKTETLSDKVMKEMQDKVNSVKAELDKTVTAIQNTVTDFEVGKTGITSGSSIQKNEPVSNYELKKIINEENSKQNKTGGQ
jgi:ATP-dependent protease ClpP protease subunit